MNTTVPRFEMYPGKGMILITEHGEHTHNSNIISWPNPELAHMLGSIPAKVCLKGATQLLGEPMIVFRENGTKHGMWSGDGWVLVETHQEQGIWSLYFRIGASIQEGWVAIADFVKKCEASPSFARLARLERKNALRRSQR